MAILDHLEVCIKLPGADRVLAECPLPPASFPVQPKLPLWATNSKIAEKFVTAPENQLFSIEIRFGPEFDLENADGLHVSLKMGHGDYVNHYYSIKFSEFDSIGNGRYAKAINSAIQKTHGGHRSILFSFGPAHYIVPIQIRGSVVDQYVAFPEGIISVTIIKVTHHQTTPLAATVTQLSQLPLVDVMSIAGSMMPVELGYSEPPMVEEQVIPINAAEAYHFIFHHRSLSKLVYSGFGLKIRLLMFGQRRRSSIVSAQIDLKPLRRSVGFEQEGSF
ncbi:hypothetical protein FQN57_006356 [Myotisia sp. PD_48]|nr:hypothetical protein FQN57_006356 [Myotisia sp. PD_48]